MIHPDAAIGRHPPGPREQASGPRRSADRRGEPRREAEPRPIPHDPLSPTVFHEGWWLDIASEGRWREARVERDGRLVARLPFMPARNRLGMGLLLPPSLCHVLGPAFAGDVPADGGARSLRRFTLTAELIAQLPPAAHTWFRLHRGIGDTIAFGGAGFATVTDFTTEIAPAPEADLWRAMRDKTRNVIRRAEQRLILTDRIDPAEFLIFYEENLRRQGRRNHRCPAMLRDLIAAAVERRSGRLLVAHDDRGELAAGIFTAWNGTQEHYLLSTRGPRAGNGGIALLLWDAIRAAARAGRRFDTDGLRSGQNHLLLTGLGGVIVPRLLVERGTLAYRALQLGINALGGMRRR
ncbi:GNAT family N-acetyltransferase [Sphingomonas naphthae]|uniref:GNAT family N-acetyltransferase n=1 Tax=Sphingomonas naphthae TaxID=1813468 RepID=A0ABY7TIZ0_9SPHN|nr:GNAT family N-acetyltransferase [Sphingomonas naphthae]WCT72776.1 GNAT family N-acetyltransferase [Sphingomonas naphthae]